MIAAASWPVRQRPARLALGLIAVSLLATQVWYSREAASRVTYEELAEAVRNPVWLAHGLVYDGMSSNVGWYAALAASYRLFGFSLGAARLVRLVLHAVSIVALAAMLVRWLGWRRALVPLVTAGISPALLYFNTMSTSYGVDLQWAPILAWLSWRCGDERPVADAAVHAGLGLCLVWACLMWPGCVFYVPLWIAICVFRARRVGQPVRRRPVAVLLTAGALPFFAALALLDNPATWLSDPVTGSGVFRGGAGTLVGSLAAFVSNAARISLDVVDEGSSYYFWVPEPDLSGVLGLVPAATVVLMTATSWRTRGCRPVVLVTLVATLGAVVIAASAEGPPGLRRATLALAGFYVLYFFCWKQATDALARRPSWTARLQVAALSLLLVHHLGALAPNAASIGAPAPADERHWFAVRKTPEASVHFWMSEVDRGEPLDCGRAKLAPNACRYAEVYAAVEATRRWTRADVAGGPIRAVDPETGAVVVLAPRAWPFGSQR